MYTMDSIFNILTETGISCFTYISVFFLLLLIYLICSYWNLRHSYSNFPSCSWDVEFLRRWIRGEVPKNVPFSSYYFLESIKIFKQFENEGLILIWGIRPVLVVFAEEYVKILSNEMACVDKDPVFYNMIEEMTGKGLLTINGRIWQKRRKMLNPAFSFETLRSYLPILNERARDIVEDLAEKCNRPSLDVLEALKLGSLKILCETILGVKLNKEEHDSDTRRYITLLSSLGTYLIYRLPRPWLYFKYTQLLFHDGRKHRQLYKEFRNFINVIVMEMKDSISKERSNNEKEAETKYGRRKPFAHILLENHLKDPTFTIEDIQDELNTVIFAGHDTTAHAMLWCLFMLGLHSDVQERAFEEVESVIGNDMAYKYSDLSRLTYLESVIKETLRLYPVVPMFSRMARKEIQCGKYKIPKNTMVGFIPYMLHRDPNIYPDPEKFDPDRFSGRSLKHPWNYIAFSEGIRSCIGKNFAMMGMKVVLAHILRKFKIASLDKREDVILDWNILLAPLNPIRFKFTLRQPHLLLRG